MEVVAALKAGQGEGERPGEGVVPSRLTQLAAVPRHVEQPTFVDLIGGEEVGLAERGKPLTQGDHLDPEADKVGVDAPPNPN